jgi:hypothetical protein
MEVTTTHHIDASEPDAKGMYDWYYEYDLYRFSEGAIALIARSYVDKTYEAHFLRLEREGKPQMPQREDSDCRCSLSRRAA